MYHSPLYQIFFLYFLTKSNKIFPCEGTFCDLTRESSHFVFTPSKFLQHILIVIKCSCRNIKRHRIDFSIYSKSIKRTFYKLAGINIRKIQQQSTSYLILNVTGKSKNIRTISTLRCKQDILHIFIPVNSLIISFNLNMKILTFSFISFIQTICRCHNCFRNSNKIHVVCQFDSNCSCCFLCLYRYRHK